MTGHHHDVEKLAYAFWEERGRPNGSPEIDWFRAEEEIDWIAQDWTRGEAANDSINEATSEDVFDNEGGHTVQEGTGLTMSQGRGESRGTSA